MVRHRFSSRQLVKVTLLFKKINYISVYIRTIYTYTLPRLSLLVIENTISIIYVFLYDIYKINRIFLFAYRLGGSALSSGMGGGTLGGGGHCQLAANQPLVMPVFPLRASQPSPVPVYSPSRFHIDKRCQHRCTWKCLAISMICLCVILAAMLAYFIGKI